MLALHTQKLKTVRVSVSRDNRRVGMFNKLFNLDHIKSGTTDFISKSDTSDVVDLRCDSHNSVGIIRNQLKFSIDKTQRVELHLIQGSKYLNVK